MESLYVYIQYTAYSITSIICKSNVSKYSRNTNYKNILTSYYLLQQEFIGEISFKTTIYFSQKIYFD